MFVLIERTRAKARRQGTNHEGLAFPPEQHYVPCFRQAGKPSILKRDHTINRQRCHLLWPITDRGKAACLASYIENGRLAFGSAKEQCAGSPKQPDEVP